MAKAIENTPAATPAVKQEFATTTKQEIIAPAFNVKELSLKQADEAIASIIKSGSSLRKLAHETACGLLLHYEKHGDFTRLQRENETQAPRMIEAISSAFSRSMARAFIDWTVRYSSLRYNEETKRFYHNKRDKRIGKNSSGFFDFEAAIKNPFYDFERDPVAPKPVDFDALLKQFVERAERLLKQKVEGVKVGEKTKKIDHGIDEKIVVDLKDFALKHGVIVDEVSSATN